MRLEALLLGTTPDPCSYLPLADNRRTDQGTQTTDLPGGGGGGGRELIFSEEKNVDLIYFTGCESPLERRSSV